MRKRIIAQEDIARPTKAKALWPDGKDMEALTVALADARQCDTSPTTHYGRMYIYVMIDIIRVYNLVLMV